MNHDKKINILGQEYTVKFENTRTENVLKNADGECRWYIKEIIIDENGIKDLYVQGDGYDFENSFDIFFLTREEAEKALKERDGA